ncbi:hypothetical protein [Streptomyces formicae]|uniref:Hydrogenase expression protein HypF n=1 Tax=Streptomyces formicae TaxID=1616117 RepID=A0A291QGB9_9ACTN|nr:hypothetical protein [Streptomyces formicae]ATL30566.1 hypothetical protein KY5_5548 [Streptomyces formicae]
MPADEVHHESSAGEPRARTGPRHAAPRKPLLTRLQVPAGKAIAIAAMPTAVLMGMGLTPTLAQAKPGVPDNPFQDGPCVTAPDKDAEKDAADKAKEDEAKKDPEAAEKDAADKAKKDGSKKDGSKKDEAKEPDPSTTPSSGDKAGDKAGDEADPDGKSEPTSKPSDGAGEKKSEPAPEPTETKNPWDPLGVGEAIKDAFTPDEKKTESPEPTESESDGTRTPESSETPKSPEDKAKDTTDKVTKPVEDTVDKVEDGLKDGADKAKDGADKVTDDAEKAAKDAADKAGEDQAEDPMAPDENGKKPFPCVVEKKDAGEGEKPPAPIPNQSWNLEASSLTLKGADYQGVVNLTMPNGKTKQALKYVVQNTDIGDLHQIVEGPAGKKYHVEAAKGSTSTIRGGETTMYTERISGKLFGLIPITFDPEHPPPLNIPLIYFTDVKVQQAGQFGGNLTIPGLQQSITD